MRLHSRALGTVSLLLFFGLLFNPFLVLAQSPVAPLPAGGRFIVVFNDSVDPAAASADLARQHGLEVSHVYSYALKGFAAQVPDGRLAAIQRDPRVKLVEADRPAFVTEQTVPTGVRRVDGVANPVAKIDGNDERLDVDIAIIDTGIDRDHPDLNVVQAVDCAAGGPFGGKCTEGAGDDGNGHGSHVAGTVAALDNGYGVVGIAPGARLWAVRVFDNSGSGYVSWVIAGVDWVTKYSSEIEVANMSLEWVGVVASARQAIQNSVAKGVVYFAAAGNDSRDVFGADGQLGTSDDIEPASYPEVATISAFNDTDGQPGRLGAPSSWTGQDRNLDGVDDGMDDSFAWFSNFSCGMASDNPVSSPGKAVDLLMPGSDIYSTYKDGGYATISGTSMASPHATGLAALHIDANGRATSASGVYVIRQALINGGVSQNDTRGLAQQNDPDGSRENIGWAVPLNYAPAVAIVSPSDAAVVTGSVPVQVSATDRDDAAGSLVVQIKIGASEWQAASYNAASAVYEVVWDTFGSADGSYAIEARATDSAGAAASAKRVVVSVDNVDDPPGVVVTSPWQGAMVSGAVAVAATASDDKGVSRVEFLVDGAAIALDADGSNGWSASWNTAASPDGSHTISARATDTAGHSVDSTALTLTVDNTVPAVTLTSPASGGAASGAITVAADAADAGGVSKVEFFLDGAALSVDSDGVDGWSALWDTTAAQNGAHTLTARATDVAGNSATSATTNVTVENAAPSVIHVGDLDGAGVVVNRAVWKASVTIAVHDSNEGAVTGALVSGIWSNGYTGSATCTTDGSGRCSVTTDNVNANKTTSATFTVSQVTYSALAYDAGANHDPDGDSNGISIQIAR